MFEFLSTDIMDSGITVWQVLISAIAVAVGVIVARIVRMIFQKKFAPTMPVHTAENMTKFLYYGIIVITLLGVTTSQGIDLSGLVVAGGIFGIVIGFATQSVVSNLISGIFLLVEKPIKIKENVEVQGSNILGKVIDIGIFSTKIQLFDGTLVRVPNQTIFTSELRTFALSEIRRTDVTVGISYNDDIEKAIKVMKDAISSKVQYALIEPGPQFFVTELGDNSVNIKVQVWFPRDDLLEVVPGLLKVLKNALDEAGIEIPFPQRVIHSAKE